MSRKLHPDEVKLWRHVVATVRPAPGKHAPDAPMQAGSAHDPDAGPMLLAAATLSPTRPSRRQGAPEGIEPGRKRRIVRGRDEIDGRLDLHGLDQDRARSALTAFLRRVHDEGGRAALIITGKGVSGDGILRRRTPEWLSEPGLREIVAGVSPAARHHGGEGALYVALKRKQT